jgi:hypothetical protein
LTAISDADRGRDHGPSRRHDPNYKWVALSNTSLGVLMAAIDDPIVIIALPAIFNGIRLAALCGSAGRTRTSHRRRASAA